MKYVPLHTKRVKSDVDGTKFFNEEIEHINKIIKSGITQLNGEELEFINVVRKCYSEAKKHKENLISYDNEGKNKTSSTSENK